MPVVEELRNLGYNVLTSQEAGNAGIAIPDEEVLAFGTDRQRAILTMNRRYFIRLHEVHPDHCGIIVCSFDPSFVELARRIHEAVESQEPLLGRLVRINRTPT